MSKTRKYVFTPARRAALAKATAASAAKRKRDAPKRAAKKHAKSIGNAAIGGFLAAGPAGASAMAGHKAGAIAVSSARRRVKGNRKAKRTYFHYDSPR